MSPGRVITVANDIPVPYGRQAEAAVRKALADRRGDWRITLHEPQNASYWSVAVQGPGAFTWSRNFDGPDEQRPEYLEKVVRDAVSAQRPPFAAITKRLEAKWTKPDVCPICGADGWSVTEIPYVLTEMGGDKAMPVYPVTCINCGFTIMFSAYAAGLLPRKIDES